MPCTRTPRRTNLASSPSCKSRSANRVGWARGCLNGYTILQAPHIRGLVYRTCRTRAGCGLRHHCSIAALAGNWTDYRFRTSVGLESCRYTLPGTYAQGCESYLVSRSTQPAAMVHAPYPRNIWHLIQTPDCALNTGNISCTLSSLVEVQKSTLRCREKFRFLVWTRLCFVKSPSRPRS